MFTQVGFLGHDSGHKQVFRTRRATYAFGLLAGNPGIGLSYGWWMDKHNRHHAHPNDLERDPDVRAGALVFDAAPGRRPARLRPVADLEPGLPVLPDAAPGRPAPAPGQRAGAAQRRVRARWLEGSLLLLHVSAYVAIVALVLPARAGARVRRRAAGRLRPLPGRLVRAEPQGHADGAPRGRLGLPAPAGDHLAQHPRQPARRLRARRPELPDRAPPVPEHAAAVAARAQPLVRAFCAEIGVPYVECGLVGSYRQAVGHLHTVGAGEPQSVA